MWQSFFLQISFRVFLFSGHPMPPVQRMTPRMPVVSPNVRSLKILHVQQTWFNYYNY
jgi:hypothetical protein